MDNASDKKPLLSSNSSQASSEVSNKDSKEESKIESKKESKKENVKECPPSSGGECPPSSGDHKETRVPHRVVRPTVQARPFSTRTKGVYWIATLVHLIVLLLVLFSIVFGLLQFVFAQTRDGPLYWGTGSFIGGVPSIMHEPVMQNKDSSVKERFFIRFSPNSTDSFMPYVERLKKVTKRENRKEAENIENNHCLGEDTGRLHYWKGTKDAKVCYQQDLSSLPMNGTDKVCDPMSSPSMGYKESTPCVLIRLTKLLGFFPMSDHQREKETRPSLTEHPCQTKIMFDCTAREGENEIALLMPDGIPFCHFPYWNQKGYMAPYIMIRPEKPLPLGKTVIKCAPQLKSLKKLSSGSDNKIDITIEVYN